ncbi:dicarboxylate/amino acid:cation symporter [Chitinophagales bacterium]|jgi:Na+/H+-dicarboxylate symporter|nr:dicarboxylate/amino acid:cation symporter [Chitinophagales bacterium]
MKKPLALHWKIIIGMALGIVWSLLSAQFGWGTFTLNWIKPFGDIFLNALKLIALPLVLFSVIGGIIGIGNPQLLGRMGGKTLGLYLISTVFAVTLGLVLVNLFKPGENEDVKNRLQYELWANTNEIAIKDGKCFACMEENQALVLEVEAFMATQEISDEIQGKLKTKEETQAGGPLRALVDIVPSNLFDAFVKNSMLQIIFFAIFFGLASLYIPEKEGKIVKEFIHAINEVFLKMIDFIMLLAPYFVFALMAGVLTSIAGDDFSAMLAVFEKLIYYCIVVLLGLLAMIFIFYPLLLKLFTKDFNYKEFFKNIAPAQSLAFSTSSSAATLPVTLEVVEENLKVSKKVSSFVLPIGATVNMDGTSLYQAVAAIFLAQFHMIDLSLGQQLTIIATATLASIGSAAVPSAGLVMLMIVLTSVGLNPAWIAIILPVDRLLDMVRTTVNVTGDATIATLVDKTEKHE